MKLKTVWNKSKMKIAKKIGRSVRVCDKCGDKDSCLICMECLRKEKDKVLKEETKFQKQLNK